MICPRLGVQPVFSCAYAVSSGRRGRVHKRSSSNGCLSFVILMPNTRDDCRKRCVSLNSEKETRLVPMWQANWASVDVVIPSCVWFATAHNQSRQNRESLAWTQRRLRGGTLICGLERSQPGDLLDVKRLTLRLIRLNRSWEAVSCCAVILHLDPLLRRIRCDPDAI